MSDNHPFKKYHVSIDWLSVSCDKTMFFVPEELDGTCGYTLKDPGHGAKFWRSLRHITRTSDNREIGVMCYDNTMAENADLVVIKFANELLYDNDCFEVVCDVVLKLGLRYRGISRLDLAADFNEFNQGMLPSTLIEGYLDNKYLKGGTNNYMLCASHQYFAFGNDTAQVLSERPILDQRTREEEEQRIDEANKLLLQNGFKPMPKRRPHKIVKPAPHVATSITWGSRSSGVQVQLYNKTLEMQQKAPKWHIIKTWQQAGIDTMRDVWRLEVRIQSRGKELINQANGQEFTLNVVDILIQQQVEAIYFAYIEKYFKWYRNDGHEKLQNCKRLKLFNVDFVPVHKPRQYSRTAKSFNRTAKTIARNLEVLREECASVDMPDLRLVDALKTVRDFFRQAYKLGAWLKEQEVNEKLEAGEIPSLPPVHIPMDDRYYSWAGTRAIAIAQAQEKYSHIAQQHGIIYDNKIHYAVDWERLSEGEKNIYALFYPAEPVKTTAGTPQTISDIDNLKQQLT